MGPTAGGKSALARGLALSLRPVGGAEIVSADAFQVYRGMDVGTAKPTRAEQDELPHHMIDVAHPGARFTARDWLEGAEHAIAGIRSRGAVPIVVGGTHLYVKILLEGMFEGPAGDQAVRDELAGWETGALRAELERIDPATAARLHPNDRRRTIRAIEVYRLTGTPLSRQQVQWDRGENLRSDALVVGLDWPVGPINARINARVRAMMERGLLEETRGLWSAGVLTGQAREALGYKQLAEHLEGRRGLEDAVEAVKVETRRFAKNQRTWLKRIRAGVPAARLVWIDAGTMPEEGWPELVRSRVEGWAGGDGDGAEYPNGTRTA